jgi:hypothetical protein
MERSPVKKIKMARQYAAYKAGEVVEVSEDLAARLIAWEYATEVYQRQLQIETTSIEPKAETADLSLRRRRKP